MHFNNFKMMKFYNLSSNHNFTQSNELKLLKLTAELSQQFINNNKFSLKP